MIVFPPGPEGAHRITNTSATEPLRYVDLDTVGYPDVVHHVDSGKVGYSSGDDPKTVYLEASAVAFYDGEPDAG